MTQTEQRGEQRGLERYKLERQPTGRLTLRTSLGKFSIDEIKDFSENGISFVQDHSEAVSSKVVVEYADDNISFDVFGRIAWCAKKSDAEPAQPGADVFVMGVELLATTMLFAMLKNN